MVIFNSEYPMTVSTTMYNCNNMLPQVTYFFSLSYNFLVWKIYSEQHVDSNIQWLLSRSKKKWWKESPQFQIWLPFKLNSHTYLIALLTRLIKVIVVEDYIYKMYISFVVDISVVENFQEITNFRERTGSLREGADLLQHPGAGVLYSQSLICHPSLEEDNLQRL